jgi:hypothetical protein
MNNPHKLVSGLIVGLLMLSAISGGIYLYAKNNIDNKPKAEVAKETKTTPKSKETKKVTTPSTVAAPKEENKTPQATTNLPSSVVSKNTTPAAPEKPAQPVVVVTEKSFTNEFFPNFKLNYPSDWTFSTFTLPSRSIPGMDLLERTIILKKGNTSITVHSKPNIGYTCTGIPTLQAPVLANINSTGISRYNAVSGTGNYYVAAIGMVDITCNEIAFNIASTIINAHTHQPIHYALWAQVEGADNLNQADQIIAKSVWR